METAIVTDSTSDIPLVIAAEKRISVMPNLIVIDGKSYQDNIEISRQEFYDRLPAMKKLPTTATASSGSYTELYEKLFQEGAAHIISIHASSILSGIYNAASIAAQPFAGRVHVIDSGQVTMALGLQVLEAARAAAQGLPVEKILQLVDNIRPRSHLIAMLDTLEYVHRSGRVSWAAASIGSLLQIKPFIRVVDGKLLRIGESRTRAQGIARLKELLVGMFPIERLAILHTNAEKDARSLLESLDLHLEEAPLIINATPVIGTHAGPCALGFAVVTG